MILNKSKVIRLLKEINMTPEDVGIYDFSRRISPVELQKLLELLNCDAETILK